MLLAVFAVNYAFSTNYCIVVTYQNGESVEDTARRMLDFSLLSKPKHIAKLPLPKSHPEACKYILGLIGENFYFF